MNCGPHLKIPFLALVLLLLPSEKSYAFLDTLAQAAKDAAKSAAYAEAVTEVASELDSGSEVQRGFEHLSSRLNELQGNSSELYYLSNDLKNSISSHEWSNQALDENIRFSARFIGRMKRFLVSLGLVGTDVATAMNTAETNAALNEVLKNQQTQILLSKERDVGELSKEIETQKTWEQFLAHEKALREVPHD